MRQRALQALVAAALGMAATTVWAAPYTVQPGDTLYSLARRFGTTPAALQQVNNLKDPGLKVGQTLEIPERQHTVAAGETLFSLARRYGVGVAELRALNRLSTDALRVGQVVLIPWSGAGFGSTREGNTSGSAHSSATPSTIRPNTAVSSAPAQPSPARPATAAPSGSAATSRPVTAPPAASSSNSTAPSNPGVPSPIVPATTNSRVSPSSPASAPSSSGVTTAPSSTAPDPNALPSAIPPAALSNPERPAPTLPSGSSAGRPIAPPAMPAAALPSSPTAIDAVPITVMLPEPADQPVLVHVVATGDTLFNIARRYGVSVADLKTANALTVDTISLGQRLRIPSTLDPTVVGAPRGVRDIAERYLGVTYVYGGTSQTGLDCSGFVSIVFNELGVRLPRTSREQYTFGTSVNPDALELGDLVFFDTLGAGAVSHVGIYLSDGEFIHAASNPGKVIKSKLSEKYYAQRYLGARRVLPQD